jgi:hypothetical protein
MRIVEGMLYYTCSLSFGMNGENLQCFEKDGQIYSATGLPTPIS